MRLSVRSRSCSSVAEAGPEAVASHDSQSRAILGGYPQVTTLFSQVAIVPRKGTRARPENGGSRRNAGQTSLRARSLNVLAEIAMRYNCDSASGGFYPCGTTD